MLDESYLSVSKHMSMLRTRYVPIHVGEYTDMVHSASIVVDFEHGSLSLAIGDARRLAVELPELLAAHDAAEPDNTEAALAESEPDTISGYPCPFPSKWRVDDRQPEKRGL